MKTNRVAAAALIAAVAAPAAFAQEAVQWRVEDGGNGHWYEIRCAAGGMTWSTARTLAESAGGDLATLVTPAEHAALVDALAPEYQCGQVHIGGWKQNGQWEWITGETWEFAPWDCGQCAANECQPDIDCENRLAAMCIVDDRFNLNNIGDCFFGGVLGGYIIEWSADCNGDGIVDYGQLRDGTLDDANGNGVPDCCDEGVSCNPCLGDVNNDGQVNGADISVLLGFWGLNGKPVAADINKDGSVDGADLAAMLGGWGECP